MSGAGECDIMRPLCSHIRPHDVAFSHRAKPVSEMKRSGIELHCGPAPCSKLKPSPATAHTPHSKAEVLER